MTYAKRFSIERPVTPHFVDLSPATVERAGFAVVRDEVWHGRMHVRDVEALCSYVRAVPWELPGLALDTHLPVLQELDNQREPISFGISRSLLLARRTLG